MWRDNQYMQYGLRGIYYVSPHPQPVAQLNTGIAINMILLCNMHAMS